MRPPGSHARRRPISRPRLASILAFGCAALFSASTQAVGAQVLANPGSAFVFSPGDRVQVSVWPDESLSGVFPVEASGVVHLPLLGPTQAAGLSVAEFREELRSGYARDLQMPVVSVQAQFRVSVLGAVRASGLYWANPDWGVFDLLAEAGGFVQDAEEDRIVITRRSGESFSIDAELLQVPGSGEASIALRAGDRLVVPEAGGFNWGIFLQVLTLAVSITSIATR